MHKSVLLVDEDPDVLSSLTQLLESDSLRVLRARNKPEAREILGRPYVPVDLVVANMMLARMGSPDFVMEVNDIRPGVPVLYMSAFVEEEVVRVEPMNNYSDCGFTRGDEQGFLHAVFSALSLHQAARAS